MKSIGKRRTPALALSGAVLATAALAGCGGSGTASSPDGGTVKITTFNGLDKPFEKVIEAFEKANPKINVEVQPMDPGQYFSLLRTQITSGNAPDVFLSFPGNGNTMSVRSLQPSGYLADLSDLSFAGRVDEKTKPLTDVDGKTYMMPMTKAALGILYDKKLWREHDLKPPTTYSELLGLCAKAKEAGKPLMSLGMQQKLDSQGLSYAMAASLVYSKYPDFDQQLADGKQKFAGSPWEEAFTKFKEMDDKGCFNEDPTGTTAINGQDMVFSRKVFSMVATDGLTGTLKNNGAKDAEWAFAALPSVDDPAEVRVPAAPGLGYSVYGKSKHLAAAKKFVDFLAQPEQMRAYNSVNGGGLPGLPDPEAKPDAVSQYVIDTYLEPGRTAPFPDQLWPNAKVQEAHVSGVQQLFSGQADPEDITRAMDEAYGRKG